MLPLADNRTAPVVSETKHYCLISSRLLHLASPQPGRSAAFGGEVSVEAKRDTSERRTSPPPIAQEGGRAPDIKSECPTSSTAASLPLESHGYVNRPYSNVPRYARAVVPDSSRERADIRLLCKGIASWPALTAAELGTSTSSRFGP
jgi:hypothetical protein